MEYLTVEDVLIIHVVVIEETGGCPDILDAGLVESAVEQARQTFGGEPLYPTIEEVAAAYWHSNRHEPWLQRRQQAHSRSRCGLVLGTQRLPS